MQLKAMSMLSRAVAVVRADGVLHPFELECLESIGRRYGLDAHHVQDVLAGRYSRVDHVESAADSLLDRLMLLDCIGMMFVDGECDDRERSYCTVMLMSYGLDEPVAGRLIAAVQRQCKQGRDTAELLVTFDEWPQV